MRVDSRLKPQDLMVLLKILLWQDHSWRQVDLGRELGLSQAEVNFSLNRLVRSGLLDATKKRPLKLALAEFLIHGLRYVFPAEIGPVGMGVPTAYSHDVLANKFILDDSRTTVWPDPTGRVRGHFVEPLYPSAPMAARKDPALHEWLAILDGIRIGSVRVRKFAIEQVYKKIGYREGNAT